MAPTPTVTVTMVSLGLSFPSPLETFCPKLFDLRGLLLVPVSVDPARKVKHA